MGLEQFDGVFNPANTGRADGLETLTDGDYTLTIMRANLGVVETRTGESIDTLSWQYRTSTGQVIENTSWLRDIRACNVLGADLALLGFPVNTWNAGGVPFSKALPAAVQQLPGIVMLATKTSYEKNGKVYHNLRVRSRAAAPQPMPTKQGNLDLSPNDQLPF